MNELNLRVRQLRIAELVGFYIALMVLYIVTPDSLQVLRRVISPVMLGVIALTAYSMVLKLKR